MLTSSPLSKVAVTILKLTIYLLYDKLIVTSIHFGKTGWSSSFSTRKVLICCYHPKTWSIGQDLNLRLYGFADRSIGPLWHRCMYYYSEYNLISSYVSTEMSNQPTIAVASAHAAALLPSTSATIRFTTQHNTTRIDNASLVLIILFPYVW